MDTIFGDVYEVVDGDTFNIEVTHHLTSNSRSYNKYETIRIAGMNAPELNTVAGKLAKASLATKILGKHVKLAINARDDYGRLVCNVELAVKSLK